MSGRLAAVVAVLVALVAAAAATATAPTKPARSATAPAKAELVVALSLPAPGFQVGAVRGGEVVYARGLEIDLARALARRLGEHRVRFVQFADARRLVAPGAKRWDLALARLVPRPGRSVSFSAPYLRADQAVLVARGVPRPRGIAELRRMHLCAVRGTRGADVLVGRLRAARRELARDGEELLRWTQTARCEAAVADTATLAVLLRGAAGRFGRIAGAIETGAAYAVALPAGSPLLADVDRVLARLRRDGTLRRLTLRWLAFDPARLRPLSPSGS